MSRSTVFVGNIAYDVKEQELRKIFERAGNVVSFRFVVDKETGKPRGFGFCEYQTEQQAQQAIDTLNNFEVHGRNIKVDSADGNQDGSGSGPRGGRQQQKDIDKALEQLGIREIYNVVEGFKNLIEEDYSKARQLLQENPVLAVALVKAQAMLRPLQQGSQQSQSAAQAPTVQKSAPVPLTPLTRAELQSSQWAQPQQMLSAQQQQMLMQQQILRQQQMLASQQMPPNVDIQNQQLINEILQLTPQQIENLPPQERENVFRIIQQLNLTGQRHM